MYTIAILDREKFVQPGQITFCQATSRQYWDVSRAKNDSQDAVWVPQAD